MNIKQKKENVNAKWNDKKKKKKKKKKTEKNEMTRKNNNKKQQHKKHRGSNTQPFQNLIDLHSWVRRDTDTTTAFPLE